MQLTTQMQAEMATIQTRVDNITHQVWIPFDREWRRTCYRLTDEGINIINAVNAELNPYKVRLENILSETDMKEQVRSQIIHTVNNKPNGTIFNSSIFPAYKGDCSFINLCKKEQLEILKLLLQIEGVHDNSQIMLDNPLSCDDYQRYLEMAIRLDPKDTEILYRKENKIYVSQRSSKSFRAIYS